MQLTKIFIASLIAGLVVHVGAAGANLNDGIEFDAPAVAWKEVSATRDHLYEWRRADKASMMIFRLMSGDKKGLGRAMQARLEFEGIKAKQGALFRIAHGAEDIVALPFDSTMDPMQKGAIIAVPGERRYVGILCAATPEAFPQVFLECRRMAFGMKVGQGLGAAAIDYLGQAKAMLAQGQSAEMVAAHLERLLAGAPASPEIGQMRERLRAFIATSGK
ncbi:MAG: hypothetical protein WC683_17965 [bacterium]